MNDIRERAFLSNKGLDSIEIDISSDEDSMDGLVSIVSNGERVDIGFFIATENDKDGFVENYNKLRTIITAFGMVEKAMFEFAQNHYPDLVQKDSAGEQVPVTEEEEEYIEGLSPVVLSSEPNNYPKL